MELIKLLSVDELFDSDVKSLAEKYDSIAVRGCFCASGERINLKSYFSGRAKETSYGEIYAVCRRINNKIEERQK